MCSSDLTGASTLSDDEVDRMVRDAEANSSADKERREKIDVKNQADSLVYQADKQMGELGDKISDEDKTKVEAEIASLKDAIASDDADKIKAGTESLQQALFALSSNMYGGADAAAAAADPGAAGDGEAPSGGGDDDVIDAEFSEEGDK